MSGCVVRALALAVVALCSGSARADDQEADALRLADAAPGQAETAGDWRAFVEAALGGAVRRSDGHRQASRRLSLDVRYDHSFSPAWRAVLADRLDLDWPAQGGGDHAINTLKEVYLSWQAQPQTLLDGGRVNVRHGVATGYNPTDYFQGDALRSVVSISPASLKENRQGSLLLRGQRLWASGSLTALYSPGLNRAPSADGLSLDVGATNHRHRALVAVSQQIGAGLTPQFLLYRQEALPTQFGLNLTGLLSDAAVAHVEWSGGRGPSQLQQAQANPAPLCACDAWRNRLATGLTYTTAKRMSLTAEYHYNGGGADQAAWNALRQGPPARYSQYRGWVLRAQELPTRQALFFYGTWQDAVLNRLDLSVMHHVDRVDASRRTWLEARYHVGHVEYAVQGQFNHGSPLSNFGALPESRSWQAVMRHYF